MSEARDHTWLAVTGTGTGVGKTHVSCGLLALARRDQLECAPWKPVETGCREGGHGLVAEDGLALARAAGRESAVDSITPLRFRLPAAPATAARREGQVLTWQRLEALRGTWIRESGARCFLLEGAGGLLVPYGPDGTFADYLTLLRPSLLVVAPDALGTLNATLLTVEAAEHRGLPVCGIVLNAAGPQPCELEHREELQRLLPRVPVWGPLPWRPSPQDPHRTALDLEEAGVSLAQLYR